MSKTESVIGGLLVIASAVLLGMGIGRASGNIELGVTVAMASGGFIIAVCMTLDISANRIIAAIKGNDTNG